MTSRARVLAILAVPGAIAACVAGCAESPIEALTPEIQETLPDVDAGGYSIPVPSDDTEDPADQADAAPSTQQDSGSTPPPPTPPVDSGPPPVTGPTKPVQGEILITEVMFDPSGTEPDGEWIELRNMASSARTLTGLAIVDGANRAHLISASGLTINPGAYVVLARLRSAAIAAKVPSGVIVHEYGTGLDDTTGVQLANGATGKISLKDGSTIIAQASYGGWYSTGGGASIQLKTLTYASGTSKNAWCVSTTPWTSGSEKGTPGAASDCP